MQDYISTYSCKEEEGWAETFMDQRTEYEPHTSLKLEKQLRSGVQY